MEDRVRVTLADHVAEVRLSRPDKMNALDPAMFEGIVAAIDQVQAMDGVRCVVLAGEGRAFCAGLDMASMATGGSGMDLHHRPYGNGANLVQQVAWGWRTLPVPVIAAVHGVAFGGGFQIMSGADVRFAAPGTRFAIREAHWGLIPDMAGPTLWRTFVRDDILRELTYTAREFDAEEAARLGFVTHVAEHPLDAAHELARAIAARNPEATRAAKALYNRVPDATDAEILVAESELQLKVIRQPNQIEAVRANMEKRAPVFQD